MRNGTKLGQEQGMEDWAFEPREMSQPIHLKKELADEAGKSSFRFFCVIWLGKVVS